MDPNNASNPVPVKSSMDVRLPSINSRGGPATGTSGVSDGTADPPASRSNKLWRSKRYSSSLKKNIRQVRVITTGYAHSKSP